MRRTPLIIALLCILLCTRVSAADAGVAEASTIPKDVVITTTSQESTYGVSGLEKSSTSPDSLDFSFMLVLTLGVVGLLWVRRQSQAL